MSRRILNLVVTLQGRVETQAEEERFVAGVQVCPWPGEQPAPLGIKAPMPPKNGPPDAYPRFGRPPSSYHALGQRSLRGSASLELDVMFAVRPDAVFQDQHRPDIRFKRGLVHRPIPVCDPGPKPFPPFGGRASKIYDNRYL